MNKLSKKCETGPIWKQTPATQATRRQNWDIQELKLSLEFIYSESKTSLGCKRPAVKKLNK